MQVFRAGDRVDADFLILHTGTLEKNIVPIKNPSCRCTLYMLAPSYKNGAQKYIRAIRYA